MQTYKFPLVPGPTSVPQNVLAAYQVDYGSSDLEDEYFQLYEQTQQKLQSILKTENSMVIMTGEAMAVLWGALKSCLEPGDKVLAVATGVFGYGIADMARLFTENVEVVEFEYDKIADPNKVEEAIKRVRPKMVTAVHCETPSGTLNPIAEIGSLIKKYNVPLFYVDAVSSAAGAPLETDAWNIDLCLVGTQKCLSAPPDLGIAAVSDRAWSTIQKIDDKGYDALAPFHFALENHWFPYTPAWHSLAVLDAACDRVLRIGLETVIEQHSQAAELCRGRIQKMGLQLYPQQESTCSPTVTAVNLPKKLKWKALDRRLREHGMVVGGSLGKLDGKVFRIGHMGTQADTRLIEQAMDILEKVV